MRNRALQDFLPLVEKPSRYLGSETNTIKKSPERVKLRIALAFPDLYEIGTSHFGMQILYHILNGRDDIAAERVFSPGIDLEERLRKTGHLLPSLESGDPLGRFDIVGFSLLYELNYTNMLNILDLAGIPFLAGKRDPSHPLIVAGGPCTCNPEPVADIFDAMVIGDGEEVFPEMADRWIDWNSAGKRGGRKALLRDWSKIEGVYIPSFFTPEFDTDGFQRLRPEFGDYTSVPRSFVGNLDDAPFPDRPILPFGRPIHDRLRLEVSRGCTRGCRFCQAGMIYRPVRERSPRRLLSLAERSLAATGHEDLSLLSLSTGDYTQLDTLMEHLMERCLPGHIAVSLPSIRAGTLTPKLMRLIRQVRKTGFTIAPEAGSQRLRDVINKNITEAEIADTVRHAFDLGWQVIKLYFMIGLPTETSEDLEEMVALVRRLKKITSTGGRRGKINVSVTTFIPKPHTPFQWSPQIPLELSMERLAWLKNRFRGAGVHLKWQAPEVSLIEGLWSRGDRRLTPLLIDAYQKGCKFDGWSDSFRFDLWRRALSDIGVDIDFYTTRSRAPIEPLPWDHIDMKVSKDYLREEWDRAVRGDLTPDCRWGDCNDCGVCDFDAIAPRVFSDPEGLPEIRQKRRPEGTPPDSRRIRVTYSKLGPARFLGHLELVSIFFRALRRASVPIQYSEGFHPKPRVSFPDPLPLGTESQEEYFDLAVPESLHPDRVIDGLNYHLPPGLLVTGCGPWPGKGAVQAVATYRIVLSDGRFEPETIDRFEQADTWWVDREKRKGKLKKVNLKDMVIGLAIPEPETLVATLRSEPGRTVRPIEILTQVCRLDIETARQTRIVKLKPEGDAAGC